MAPSRAGESGVDLGDSADHRGARPAAAQEFAAVGRLGQCNFASCLVVAEILKWPALTSRPVFIVGDSFEAGLEKYPNRGQTAHRPDYARARVAEYGENVDPKNPPRCQIQAADEHHTEARHVDLRGPNLVIVDVIFDLFIWEISVVSGREQLPTMRIS
jgi:hypothetical protein